MSAVSVKTIGNAYVLANDYLQVYLIDYGATVTHLWVPDRDGNSGDVLLGCPTVLDHLKPHPHFNCIVGRYSNRMTNARFSLGDKEYLLELNIPPHHLHGGSLGFANRIWASEPIDEGVRFSLNSPDGDAGYPGELRVTATYRLQESTLELSMSATTTKPTPVSLTAHHYFNLSAGSNLDVTNHLLQIDADHYLPVSEALTQLGKIESVSNSPFDFRQMRSIRKAMATPNPQIDLVDGFDHSFVINGTGLRDTATLVDPISGRQLKVRTDQPAVQLYTSNSLKARGKNGVRYPKYAGICLETQQFPDAPNHDAYPNAILHPSETWQATTQFNFGISA